MVMQSRSSKKRGGIVTHGHRVGGTTRTYEAWRAMHKRCTEVRCAARYKGRGITVCVRWRRFENFLVDMGEAPPGLTLDRRDNGRGYSKANCRWATRREQQQNMRSNVNITHAGQTHCMAEWARRIGISKERLHWRLKNGWTIERALTC